MRRQYEDKRRWQKKIGGRDYRWGKKKWKLFFKIIFLYFYRSDEDDDGFEDRQRRRGKGKNGQFDKTPKKDRKYALYWDERDDPRLFLIISKKIGFKFNIFIRYQQNMTKEEYDHRRRKDFNQGSISTFDNMSDQRGMKVDQYGGGHRR